MADKKKDFKIKKGVKREEPVSQVVACPDCNVLFVVEDHPNSVICPLGHKSDGEKLQNARILITAV